MFLQERSPPCVDDFLYICDDAYKREELISTETSILQTLSFDINIPIPYRFLRRYAKVCVGVCVGLCVSEWVSECSSVSWDSLLCHVCSVWMRAWTHWPWPVTTARWVSWTWSWCQREARCWHLPACWWRWSPRTWEDGWVYLTHLAINMNLLLLCSILFLDFSFEYVFISSPLLIWSALFIASLLKCVNFMFLEGIPAHKFAQLLKINGSTSTRSESTVQMSCLSRDSLPSCSSTQAIRRQICCPLSQNFTQCSRHLLTTSWKPSGTNTRTSKSNSLIRCDVADVAVGVGGTARGVNQSISFRVFFEVALLPLVSMDALPQWDVTTSENVSCLSDNIGTFPHRPVHMYIVNMLNIYTRSLVHLYFGNKSLNPVCFNVQSFNVKVCFQQVLQCLMLRLFIFC